MTVDALAGVGAYRCGLLPTATGHSPAQHYPVALNAWAAWYTHNIDSGALFSRRYGFARAMVDQALALGWIPNERRTPLADCSCDQRCGERAGCGVLRPEDTVTQPDDPTAWYYSGKLGQIPPWRTPGIPPTDGMAIVKAAAYVEVPHELLVDSDPSHVCGPDCPPEPAPLPPLPWTTRMRYALRRARWRVARLGGLRLVHRDRDD